MSHFVAYVLHFQEIIVYKIPPRGRESTASSRSNINCFLYKANFGGHLE